MPNEASRVPTAPRDGWTVDTALDHVLSLIASNDLRYEQRFEASQKALDLGFSGQKSAVDAAFAAQKSAIDAAFSAQKEGISAALAAADRAVNKAELATEKRFESVNEFRGTLDNQQRTLIPRSEVDVMVKGLEEKISNLVKLLDELRNRERAQDSASKGVRDGWGYAVGVIGFIAVLAALFARFGG